MDSEKEPKATLQDIIPKDFEVLQVLGQGVYGKVIKCVKRGSKMEVAIKIPHSKGQRLEEEGCILSTLMKADLDQTNIVRYMGSIHTPYGPGLVLEALDMNLLDFKKKVFPKGFCLCDIRALIGQMATALGVMCDYGIIHTDIKTDNIMVSDHMSQQLQFKLIDFGLAMYLDSVKPGTTVACLPLRAPEVILGLHFNGAVDMWSLGVTVVELMLKKALFTPSCEFEALKAIVKVLGSLPQRMLNKSLNTPEYFLVDVDGWRLRKTEDYEKRFGLHKYQIKNSYSEKFSSLRQLLKKDYKMHSPLQTEELDSCIDLLRKMVDVDDVTRITPGQIHLHPFISTCWKEAPESCYSSLEAEDKPERKQQSSDSDSDYESESFVSLDIQMLLPREFFLITCLGKGNFGQMVLCKKMDTKQSVCVKLPQSDQSLTKEVSLLRRLQGHHEKYNIVEYLETIDYGFGRALVFEELDISLTSFLHYQGQIRLNEIRPILQQAATALKALKSMQIIVTDLTLDTIWLRTRDPIEVKLIDFSSAIHTTDAKKGKILQQNVDCRAPEVILGLPLSEAIDVWSLANVTATMLLGFSIFPEQSEFEALKIIVRLLELPANLDGATKVNQFFKKTDEEYTARSGQVPAAVQASLVEDCTTLHELVEKNIPDWEMYEGLALLECIDLLCNMFAVNPAERITPALILHHNFITQNYCQRSVYAICSSDSEEEEEVEKTEDTESITSQTPAKDTIRPARLQPCQTFSANSEPEGASLTPVRASPASSRSLLSSVRLITESQTRHTIETQARPRTEATETQTRPRNEATETQARPRTEATETQARPWTEAIETQARPRTKATETQTRPETKATETQARPCTEAIETQARPWTEAIETQARPRTEATETQARPQTEAIETQARPRTEATETQARPRTEATETQAQARPRTEATETQARPRTETQALNTQKNTKSSSQTNTKHCTKSKTKPKKATNTRFNMYGVIK